MGWNRPDIRGFTRLRDPAFDLGEFSAGGMQWATQPDDRIDSVPFNIDPWVLYYNKELFDAKGVGHSKSFAEIVDAAAKLRDPAKGIVGFDPRQFVARGAKHGGIVVSPMMSATTPAPVPDAQQFHSGLRAELDRPLFLAYSLGGSFVPAHASARASVRFTHATNRFGDLVFVCAVWRPARRRWIAGDELTRMRCEMDVFGCELRSFHAYCL